MTKEKKSGNKGISAQEQVGGKVNAGLLDSICAESGAQTIDLYHGIKRNSVDYVVTQGSLIPRVCSEGGPKAIYFSEYPLQYENIIKLTVPVNEFGYGKTFEPYANKQWIALNPISLNDYHCRFVRMGDLLLDDSMINLWKQRYSERGDAFLDRLKEHWFQYCPIAFDKYVRPLITSDSTIDEETKPSEVDLSSFAIKKSLNPEIWENNYLKSQIRMRLLDIVDDFLDFAEIDQVYVEDIIFTGSLANFNWSSDFSDIDVHIIIDFSEISDNPDFVKQYCDSKRKLWNDAHKSLRIYGYPIELYIQDINEQHNSSGVYSIERNCWIYKPKRDVLAKSKVNKRYIKEAISDYMNKIDRLEFLLSQNKTDKYRVNIIEKKSVKLFERIKAERKNGFYSSNGKEINNGNIIFKALRRNNYIEKLMHIRETAYDIVNSIN